MSFSLQFLERACATNLFLRWRAERVGFAALCEKPDQSPPEALLQQVWRYQRLVQERLRTLDGRPVKILHPGFWNKEPGPDFRGAVVKIGDDPPKAGDIEIDLVPAGWQHHSHAGNPAYRDVVLHVTWEPSSGESTLPTLCLKHALDSTIPELSFWLGVQPKPQPDGLAGNCAMPLRSLPANELRNLLRQAAQARLYKKAAELQARARQFGWERALQEGLFTALGYKRNTWPMKALAVVAPRLREGVDDNAEAIVVVQARCFGVSGLLPPQLSAQPGATAYMRRIWDLWWREADAFSDLVFPSRVWNLGGIRPANHPQRRVALAAHWLLDKDIAGKLENWLTRRIESPDLIESLDQILQVTTDQFWGYRWTWNSQPFRQPQPLLGEQRISDLAVNVVLPWLFVRACAGANEALAKAAEARYLLWPAGEDNSVLKLARQRLLGGVSAKFLKMAYEQQALIQIVRDFCDHSNAACDGCQFPDLVKAAAAAGAVAGE